MAVKECNEEYYQTFVIKHQQLAIYGLFEKEIQEMLLSKNEIEKIDSYITIIKEGKVKSGIIDQIMPDNKPSFIHRSFAEYFAAIFLVNQLREKSEDNKVQKFLLTNIFIKSDYKVIRAFLDNELAVKAPLNIELEKIKLEKCENIIARAIELAAEDGNIQITKFLLDNIKNYHTILNKGADFNDKDIYGKKAIHYAAENGVLDIVKLLVEKGADFNDKDIYGKKAIHYAAENGNFDVVKWLVENGADFNAKDEIGSTAIHYAAENGNFDVVKWLVENGAYVNAKDEIGSTAIHYEQKLKDDEF